MPRSRPASNPLSFHKATGQHYVTRGGRRVYLGAERNAALARYHRLALGLEQAVEPNFDLTLTAKEMANRFITAQQANWLSPQTTVRCYLNWLGRFLADHPRLVAADFTIERFAAWKLSLRGRGYAAESINHYLAAVRALFRFGEEAGLLEKVPRLGRVRNEPKLWSNSGPKLVYTATQIRQLLAQAGPQLRGMLLLALNCGFGPKDMQDLCWDHFEGERVMLPRSKTGVSQTFALWPETRQALAQLAQHRRQLVERLGRRGRARSDAGRVFITKYWRPWNKDAVAEQFRRLCKRANVPCYGFYRLRHCASTAMALVAMPHVQRRFMRHKQLQQQVTYTHTPDAEVDVAVMRAREKLLASASSGSESGPGPVEAAAPTAGPPPGPAGCDAPETRSRHPA